MSMADIASLLGPDGTSSSAGSSRPAYGNWDADVLYGCVCDPGWTSADCSSRTFAQSLAFFCFGFVLRVRVRLSLCAVPRCLPSW